MIVAGEVSGDMHAARLVEVLSSRMPGLRAFGIGGEQMRAAGVETVHDISDMAVMGFSEVMRRFAFFRRVFYETVRLARDRKPDAVILVDYPGFNLRFAAKAHALGLKVIYYICPQVWAWNRGRIPRMARVVDRLIAIFPFEARYFEGTGLRVDFVGHPLVDEAALAWKEPEIPLPWTGSPRIAILPGSRPHEVERILPIMWEAAGLMQKQRSEASFLVAAPSDEIEAVTRRAMETVATGPARWDVVAG